MKKIIFCAVAVGFIFCLAETSSYAETVILKDGTEYKGNIPHQDSQVVYVIQGMELIKIKAEDVKEIKKDEEVKKKVKN